MTVSENGDRSPHREDHPLGLSGQVYDRLVGMMLTGELEPLQPLRVHSLAHQLGVSATPVREALVRAAAMGIVDRENNKGFTVAPRLDIEGFEELFTARITIEAATVELAATRIDAAMIGRLEATWQVQQEWRPSDGVEGFETFLAADREFHNAIAKASGNRFLAVAFETLGAHVQRFRYFDNTVVTDQAETLAEHRAIIEALRTRNPLSARSAMMLHLSNLRGRVRRERE